MNKTTRPRIEERTFVPADDRCAAHVTYIANHACGFDWLRSMSVWFVPGTHPADPLKAGRQDAR